ncbi:MAG: alpha/beta fold hydrolase [Anaerolineales bacterium]
MELEKITLTINGHQIYIEKYHGGNQALIVLLHHGLGSVQAWQKNIPSLIENGFTVWNYDRWGYGGSSDRPILDPPWFNDDVSDLFEILKGQAKPIFLVGHSDGGNIALSYTLKYPQNISGLIIVAAHIYIELKMVEGMMGLMNAYRDRSAFKKGLERIHGQKAVFERWWKSWTNLPPNWDMRTKLGEIQCPVLVIQGDEDEHATPKHALDLAHALPGGEAEIISKAKHMLPQDDYERFNPLMLTFVHRVLKKESEIDVQ